MPSKRKDKIKFIQRHFLKIFAAVLLFSVISLFRGDYSLFQYFHMKKNMKQSEARSEALKHEKILLNEEKKRLKTDDEYIEKIAREKYKMTKKGEKITRIVRSSGSDN